MRVTGAEGTEERVLALHAEDCESELLPVQGGAEGTEGQ